MRPCSDWLGIRDTLLYCHKRLVRGWGDKTTYVWQPIISEGPSDRPSSRLTLYELSDSVVFYLWLGKTGKVEELWHAHTACSRNEFTTCVSEESFPSMDVNHLWITDQLAAGCEANGNEERPALRSISQTLRDHLLNECRFSAWGDHLCVCAGTDGGRREFLFNGALLDLLSA